MIQCIRSSSWTGYMLMKVRHDLPEVGFVKIPRDDRGTVRMFVNVSTEHNVQMCSFGTPHWRSVSGAHLGVLVSADVQSCRGRL